MKIKKITLVCFILMLLAAGSIAAENEREIFAKARLDLADENWQQALKGFREIIDNFPSGRYYAPAYLYKGKCLEKMGESQKALTYYRIFLDISRNESLKDEALRDIIDLDFALYEKGKKAGLREIFGFLKSKDLLSRYYAAVKLSYAKDKEVAARAVPVLKEIISRESEDAELVDRAKIALLRIDPGYLQGLAKSKNSEPKAIHIKIYEKDTKTESLSLNIPFVLARLALDAIPEKEKKLLRDKGYDLDRLIGTLIEGKDVVKIETEDTVLRIWIE